MKNIPKQYVYIVVIHKDGENFVHIFRNYSDAEEKFTKCVKESKDEISKEQLEDAIMEQYFYDEYDNTVITLDTREIQ